MSNSAATYLANALSGSVAPLPADVSWHQVARLASAGRVEPMTLRVLGEQLPESEKNSLTERANKAAFVGLRALQERDRVLLALKQANVCPAVLLKGAVLGWLIYPDPLLRPMNDIDILVSDEHMANAEAALVGLGYEKVQMFVGRPVSERAYHERAYFRYLVPGKVVQLIELHTGFAQSFRFCVPYNELLQRAKSFPKGGPGAYCLEENDQLIHLAIHLACMKFQGPLKHLLDVHLWIENTALDWDTVVARAVAWGAATSLSQSLWLSRQVFGTSIPEPVLHALGPGGLRGRLLKWWHTPRNGQMTRWNVPPWFAQTVAQLPLLDSHRQRARFIINYARQRIGDFMA
jgi:hypothetical protein